MPRTQERAMDLESNQPSNRKARSTRACQGCRLAKARCDPIPHESQCRRCLSTSSPCHFLSSRRGRIKGSKNRRTIERLAEIADENSDLSSDQIVVASPSNVKTPQDPENIRYRTVDSGQQETGRYNGNSAPVSRAATPWNPQNLFVNDDPRNGACRPPLGRRLQNILGEFPVEHGKRRDRATEPKETQEPLWRITGLCERNWDLQDGDRGNANRNPLCDQRSSLPEEDEKLLHKWTPRALRYIQKEQADSYKHGMFGSKRDVSRALDPIYHGLLDEDKAKELFQVYWELLHPQWPILDSDMHSLDRVRTRSALLTTVILALASTILSVKSDENFDRVTEALRLHAHVEKLNLVVFATAAKSVDIVQAQILLSRWGTCPKTRLDEQRWMRVAMIPRMAAEIGLHLPRKYDNAHQLSHEETEMMRLNDIRTRALMIISEHRFFTFSGRPPMDTSQFELTSEEMKDRGLPPSLTASYTLLMFDRDARRRIDQCQPGIGADMYLESETDHIKSYLARWIETWCCQQDPTLNWHLKHDALGCCLLLVVRIAKKRLDIHGMAPNKQTREDKKRQQQFLLELCIRIFEGILSEPRHTICTTHRASIVPFAGSIVLKLSNRRDILLRVALRMAGEPGRPFVPTFVREAGIQLLLMLEMNSSGKTAAADEGELNQTETSPDATHAATHDRTSSTRMEEDHGYGTYDPVLSSAPDVMGLENMFMFNTTDLPYVPNLTQPPNQHSYPPLTCIPDDLDADLYAWLGSSSPETCAETLVSMRASAPTMENTDQFSLPVESSHPLPPPLSTASDASQMWGAIDANTPGSTTFAHSATTTSSQRNPQKEVLLATVSWLTQIASIM